jgi:hypothetical protein
MVVVGCWSRNAIKVAEFGGASCRAWCSVRKQDANQYHRTHSSPSSYSGPWLWCPVGVGAR